MAGLTSLTAALGGDGGSCVVLFDESRDLCDARRSQRADNGASPPSAHGDRINPQIRVHAGACQEEECIMSIGPIQAFVIGFPDSDLFEGVSPRTGTSQ